MITVTNGREVNNLTKDAKAKILERLSQLSEFEQGVVTGMVSKTLMGKKPRKKARMDAEKTA